MEGGEGRFYLDFSKLTLGYINPPQISTTKVNVSFEINAKSSYFSIEIKKKSRNPQKSQKITKNHKSLNNS